MNEKNSLLNKISSNFILKDIMILSFRDMKSVLKFAAYNKALLNKLDINIKDYYDYKTKIVVKKSGLSLFAVSTFADIIIFINLLIYDIIFYAKGTFNEKNLEKVYDNKKKNYIDIINNYIILLYLIFLLISYLLLILYYKSNKIVLKGMMKLKILIIHLSISLSYFIVHILKFVFTKKIIKKELLEAMKKYKLKNLWFYEFDKYLIYAMPIFLFIKSLCCLFSCCYLNKSNKNDDEKSINLRQINGFDISNFKLPLEFEKLSPASKIQMIFNKESMKRYISNLDYIQSILIEKFNLIRRQNNIPDLKYYEEQQLPYYLINKKTEFIFNEEKNIYKFSSNYYLIKYPTSQCFKDINNENIRNILTFDFLDKINIIRKDYYEYIALYNNEINENDNDNIIRENNNNINNINTNINIEVGLDLPSNIISTEVRLNEDEQSINLSGTRVNDNDNDRTGNIMIRNIRVNENPFEK